jgi:cytidine deaminase
VTSLDDLVEAAEEARSRAYAPHSGFGVGAAVLAGDRVFVGVNVENESFPLSMCAERNALAAMVAAGELRAESVALVTDSARPSPPCGGCRQVLHELAPEARVVSATLSGARSEWTVAELLPAPFSLTT